MFSRCLLARSAPLRLSATLTTRVCSRSLSVLRLPQPACVVAPGANLRQFSTTPTPRTETQDDKRTRHPPSGRCFIANIPYKVTAEELKDAFSEFGKVESVKLLMSDAGLPRGIGFVQFESVADAVSFVEANDVDPIYVLDRELHVRHADMNDAPKPAEPCDTLMLHDFRGTSSNEVRDMFGEYADSIQAVRFNKQEAGRPSRRAFVQFHNVDIAADALDAFRNQDGNSRITFARQRQPPLNAYPLTSRLSQHRG